MNIGITASQAGLTEKQMETAQRILASAHEFHHGDCTGGDADLHAITREVAPEAVIHVHPPDDNKKRAWCDGDVLHDPQPYRVRNTDIVGASEILIAFPSSTIEIVRSGTWMTVRIGRKTKAYGVIVWPNGKTTPLDKSEMPQ